MTGFVAARRMLLDSITVPGLLSAIYYASS
jgi:hypothetical protein